MENILRTILAETSSAFCRAERCALSTVARRVKNDPNFFARLSDPTKSFTARTFDDVMRWFAENWPAGRQMPLGLMQWIADTGYQGEASDV